MSLSTLMTDPPVGNYLGATQLVDGAITPQYGIEEIPVYGNGYQRTTSMNGPAYVGSNPSLGSVLTKVIDGEYIDAGAEFIDIITGAASDEINYQRNKRDYQEQFKANNKEYDRRVAQQNEWNAGWADRLRAQGINPLSAVGQGVSGSSASMTAPNAYSGPLSDLPNILDNLLTSSKIGNTNADTGTKTWDAKLKEQLYNYNSSAYPVLIKEAEANLRNTIQEYNNLVAKENYDKESANKLKQEIVNLTAEHALLELQHITESDKHEINQAKLRQMAQDFETGKFVQEYEKWHAQHEKALAGLAETQGKISKAEFEQLYENGLFGEIKEKEKDILFKEYEQLVNTTAVYDSIWATTSAENPWNILLYLVTNIFSASAVLKGGK